MLMPVIAGVDGSDESLAAVEWAAREAARRGRPLRLVHAWTHIPGTHDGSQEGMSAVQRHLARRMLRQAEERLREVRPDMRVDEEQVEGAATQVLLGAAQQAEVLVLGSRGLTGFTGFLVGSVALGVVAKATRPVVLVRAGDEEADEHLPAADGSASTGTGHRDVVLGVNVDDPCDEVIGFAFEAALLRRARLRVVYAWPAPSALGRGLGEVAPERVEDRQDFLSAVLRVWREKYPEVAVVETVADGRAQSVLVRAATGAGLLVVGHHLAERPIGPRTGPVTHAVIHHVGCPVAVVPHE
ncbi:universal stress protein [Streptomyces blattellae]|uniref:universal stress protein n=1 Tax=Streptomyces blattellae TaxID=2569855 RepID=UPI0012B9F51C|nr:universal stress protein [Streptomyces blattellae]